MINSDFYKDKKVLVIGDTGFKGSWLSFWLKKLGANVSGFSLPAKNKNDHFNLLKLNNKINHIDGNILDLSRLVKTFNIVEPEIVFHLAAQALVKLSYSEPKLTFDTNIGGSVNVLEAIRKSNSVKSCVFVTSDKCYKNKEWAWGYREDDELGGHDPYSASKAATELVLSSYMNSYFQNFNIGIAAVRAGNVIGGGDWSENRIIPDSVKSIYKNKPIVIRNPTATRPWQHVLEPLSGYLLIGEKLFFNPEKYSSAWNFGPSSKSNKSVFDLVKRVIKVAGKGKIKIEPNQSNDFESTQLKLNCDKSNSILAWYPKWDFNETINITISWYRDFFDKKDPIKITNNNINTFSRFTSND